MLPIFTSNYLPPIQYFAHLITHLKVNIEQHDHYIKQTYRNRCSVLSANGVLDLTIPVVKASQPKIAMNEVQISYDTPWQNIHWRTIVSAYNGSPFFEFYQDDLEPFYTQKWDSLFDFNQALLKVVLEMLEVDILLIPTDEYHFSADVSPKDFRELIHPKRSVELDTNYKPQPYRQVFKERYGFVAHLSIIDLIFNKGPEARLWLKKSIEG